jgi:CubicO group peptidase (beta-lactamase class C family)
VNRLRLIPIFRKIVSLSLLYLLMSCGNVLIPHASGMAASIQAPMVQESVVPEPVSAEWDKYFLELQQNTGFSGTVLIADQGAVIHTGAYGYANLPKKDTLRLDAPFQLASVSKMFTAVAIMLLQEKGVIDYDAPVATYLPGFPYDSITVRHLLNHRSGLCRYMALSDAHGDKASYLSNEDVLRLFQEHQPELWFTPGTKFNYINTNYALLALIVERQSGLPFETFLQRNIFDPLCMTRSWTARERIKGEMPDEVTGYRRYRRGYREVTGDYLDGVLGDKGVYSTVTDLFRFDQALYGDQLLRAETLEAAFAPGSAELLTHNYGFGWRMKTWQEKVVYHFGWWRGFRSCFIRDMGNQKTVIVLSNRDHMSNTPGYWDIYTKALETPESPAPVHPTAAR